MKILQLMRWEKFTKNVSLLYDLYFNNGEHDICYVNKRDESQSILNLKIKQFEVYYDDLGKNETISFLKEYDFIVLHSLFIDTSTMLLWALNGLLHKIVWIEWGFDLYNFEHHGRLAFIKNELEKSIRNNFYSTVCIFEPDKDYLYKILPHNKSKVFYAPYCGANEELNFKEYSDYSRLFETNKVKDTVYIQVGHSATNRINHIATLNRLKQFKNEDIRIVIPLSYGDHDNAQKIKEYAESIFPKDKLMILENFMDSSKYYNLLKRIDIAIFETDRQIGLGNIYRFIFCNTKLYLTENSIMFTYFKLKGVPVMPAERIEDDSFDDFRKCVFSKDKELFMEYIKTLGDSEYKLSCWNKIYDSLRNDVE